MVKKNSTKTGFVRVGVLALVLALGAVVATVIVAKNETDFLNQAAGKQSWEGVVEKVAPCVNGNLCFQLVKTDNGKNHYLLAVKTIPFEMPALCINSSDKNKCKPKKGINLADYVGKGKVEIFGKIIDSSKPKYIYVTSVSKNNSKEQLSVTEIGTIVEDISPIPEPVPSGSDLMVSSNGRGQSVSNRAYAVSGTTGSSGSTGSNGGAHYVSPNYGGDISDPGLIPEPVPGCIPRPSCLDAKPACRIMIPEGGWCPPVKKCTPRPSCLDRGCEIAPAPGTQFCPPTTKQKSQFSLLTEDGRRYSLVSKTNSACPKGAYCAEFMAPEINFAQYVGKMVFVEGAMVMKSSEPVTGRPCPTIYPPPSDCGGQKTWWPLPSGLRYEVNRIQIANKSNSGSYTGVLEKSPDKFTSEQVYFMKLEGATYVRSSFRDLSGLVGQKLTISGDLVVLENGGGVFLNERVIPVECKVGLNSFSVSQPCDGGFRSMEYSCYDGSSATSGGPTSCKPSELWKKYADAACAGKSSCVLSPPALGPDMPVGF